MSTIQRDRELHLRGVEDLQAIGRSVAPLVWGEYAEANLDQVVVEDSSGWGGGRVLFVRLEGADPAIVVLKISGEQSASPITFKRIDAALSVLRDAGIVPGKLAEGPDWWVDQFVGTGTAIDYFHFDHNLVSSSELAKLTAAMHALPTDWYEPFRAQVIARDPALSELLASAPHHSHCWNPFGYGLENGMVFIGGGFPSPATAREIMSMQIASGVLQRFLAADCFHPQSEAGKRVVTVHGDIKPDNILIGDDGIAAIDFEFTCVAPAVNDFGHMIIFWLGAQLHSYEFRHQFLADYLKASNQPDHDEAVRALLLDAEINSICTFTGLLSNIYDQQIPLLRGAPHPTPGEGCATSDSPNGHEVLDLLADAIETIRGSDALIDEVLANGIVPTIYARKVGREALWDFMEQMRQNTMLRLFGIDGTK